MGTEKRERQKANRAARREAEIKALERQKITQRFMLFFVIGAFVIGALYLISQTGGSDEFDPAAITTTVPLDTTPTTAGPDLAEILPPEAGFTLNAPTQCPEENGSSERVTQFIEAPPMCIDETKNYSATIETTKGSFTIDLDAAAAPITVNNFVVLARYHYYEDVPFHRIIPGAIVQGGDAVGPRMGTGNPGYQIEDELPEEAYEIGSVAMANSSAPDTNGSQFFVVTGEGAVSLPLQYSKFGFISEGLDVVLAIDAVGTESGAPTEDVRIISVTINES